MKTRLQDLLDIAWPGLLLCACLLASPAAGATLDADARFQAAATDDAAVGAAEARVGLTAPLSPNTTFFTEGRAVTGAGKSGVQSADTGALSRGNSFFEVRQFSLKLDQIGDQPFSITAGRQKIREIAGLWWNRNFDALRIAYHSSLFSGFIFGGQDLAAWRTGADARKNFRANDRNIARVGFEGSWQYYYNNFIEARLLLENDHSGVAGVGTVQDASARNDTDGRLVWAGLRLAGRTAFLDGADKAAYRLDLMGVTGHERMALTTPLGSSSRTVTGAASRDVSGFGFDASVDIPLRSTALIPHLGYAFGSDQFRQPGLSGNFGRFGALSEGTDAYGAVLRPDLANIHVFTAGATMPVMTASDAGALYHYYRLDGTATSLASSGLPKALNGTDRELGQGIDLLFNANLTKECGVGAESKREVSLRSVVGVFRAGDAYGTARGDVAARGLLELKIGL